MLSGGVDRYQILLAVADAPVILAPIHFGGVGSEVWAADMVVDAVFGPAQAAKETLGKIGRGSHFIAVRLRMVDALR